MGKPNVSAQFQRFPALLEPQEVQEYLVSAWHELEAEHSEWQDWDARLPPRAWSFRESILTCLILRDVMGLHALEPMQDTRLSSSFIMSAVARATARPLRDAPHVLMNRVVVWRRFLSRHRNAAPAKRVSDPHAAGQSNEYDDASIDAVLGWTLIAGAAGRGCTPSAYALTNLTEYLAAERAGQAVALPACHGELALRRDPCAAGQGVRAHVPRPASPALTDPDLDPSDCVLVVTRSPGSVRVSSLPPRRVSHRHNRRDHDHHGDSDEEMIDAPIV